MKLSEAETLCFASSRLAPCHPMIQLKRPSCDSTGCSFVSARVGHMNNKYPIESAHSIQWNTFWGALSSGMVHSEVSSDEPCAFGVDSAHAHWVDHRFISLFHLPVMVLDSFHLPSALEIAFITSWTRTGTGERTIRCCPPAEPTSFQSKYSLRFSCSQ